MTNIRSDASNIFLRHSLDMLLLVKPGSLEIDSATPAACEFLSFAEEDLIGKAITDIDIDVTAMFFWEEISQEEEDAVDFVEGYFVDGSGQEKAVKKTVYKITENNTDWLVVRIEDNSFTQHEDEKLLHLSTQLKSTLEAARDGILVIDRNGQLMNMNHHFTDMWSIPEHVVEMGIKEISQWMVDSLTDGKQCDLVNNCLTNTEATDDVLKLELKNGRFFELTIHKQMLAGVEFGYVLDFHDITRQKQYEVALLEEREKADHANRSKTLFLSNMSHELRTPMNAIVGFSQLMQMDLEEDDPLFENLGEIVAASNHLLALINEVLDLAKVESGKVEINTEKISLKDVVDDSVAMVSTIAQKNQITIETQVDFEGLVIADRIRLGQAMINLLSNAIKYNRPKGSVTIYSKESTDSVKVFVKDTGYGISEQDRQKLFEPFQRLQAENSDIEGTGIGLTLTLKIVEMMQGQLTVESTVNEGSTFCIQLPRA